MTIVNKYYDHLEEALRSLGIARSGGCICCDSCEFYEAQESISLTKIKNRGANE